MYAFLTSITDTASTPDRIEPYIYNVTSVPILGHATSRRRHQYLLLVYLSTCSVLLMDRISISAPRMPVLRRLFIVHTDLHAIHHTLKQLNYSTTPRQQQQGSEEPTSFPQMHSTQIGS